MKAQVQSDTAVSSIAMVPQGFTLVELLIVIAIVSMLAALLLPSLSRAREQSLVMVCQSNQRQMGLALTLYASDQGEYPTNWGNDTADYSQNWGDECTGSWFGNPPGRGWNTPYVPNGSDAFPAVAGLQAGAWHRFAAGKYVSSSAAQPTGINLCTARLPANCQFSGGKSWAAGVPTAALYTYNGPHAYGPMVNNNGDVNGMYRMGLHHLGATWGVRYSQDPPPGFGWEKIAFLGCPTVATLDRTMMFEPHGHQGGAPFYQFDAQVLNNYHYDRNYLYGDLHAQYLHAASRAGIP